MLTILKSHKHHYCRHTINWPFRYSTILPKYQNLLRHQNQIRILQHFQSHLVYKALPGYSKCQARVFKPIRAGILRSNQKFEPRSWVERLACKSSLESRIAATVSALISVSFISFVEFFLFKYFSSSEFSVFSQIFSVVSISCAISSVTQWFEFEFRSTFTSASGKLSFLNQESSDHR